MSKVAIVYWSGTGNTAAMAGYVNMGVEAAGGQGEVMECNSFSAAKIADYDAIAFGCPAMGDEVLEETEFEPMFNECIGNLSGKKVALFGSYGWGTGAWMEDWEQKTRSAGANVTGICICNGAPDEEAADNLKALGGGLV
ncbi:MAG: flavodoxin [Lachnospiraceae bacterium]|nr:flavodoxin [Lachnospiraceae bacterium]